MSGMKSLILTCCAVGVLTSGSQAWAIDNCTQVTAQNETDADSVANDQTGADVAATQANILALNPTDGSLDAVQANDDEDCAAVVPTIIYDFGDAPDTYGTVVASGGAQHEVVPWLKLGTLIDAELEGAPNADANGDDTTDGADEDGVSIPSLTAGQTGPVITLATPTNTSGADAYVACWIDYDSNGTFDAGEFATATVPDANAANISLTMPDVPTDVATADAIATGVDSYARCRLSNTALTADDAAGVLNDATGIADGEVEDYPVDFVSSAVFDLALDKKLASGQAPSVDPGDTVTFTITVINQGTADATGITITDYVPAGLTLAAGANGTDVWEPNTDAGADANSVKLITAIDLAVATGSTTIDISFTVDADSTFGELVNTAEISDASGGNDVNGDPLVEKDSTPDATDNEDPALVVDDSVVGDAKANPLVDDEDDHDIAAINIIGVDLELTKRVLDTAGNPIAGPVYRGDTIVYELVVTNQGPNDATGVVVNDLLPTGVTYVSDDGAPGAYVPATGEWTVGSDVAAPDTNGGVPGTATLKITVTID